MEKRPNLPIPRLTEGVNVRDFTICVQLIIADKRGKPFGFPLKSYNFAAVIIKDVCGALIFAIASKRKVRAPSARREIDENQITRASKTALLRCAPQFAKTFAFAGKVNAARVNMVCPERARRRGKLRLYRARRGQWGFPENHENLF